MILDTQNSLCIDIPEITIKGIDRSKLNESVRALTGYSIPIRIRSIPGLPEVEVFATFYQVGNSDTRQDWLSDQAIETLCQRVRLHTNRFIFQTYVDPDKQKVALSDEAFVQTVEQIWGTYVSAARTLGLLPPPENMVSTFRSPMPKLEALTALPFFELDDRVAVSTSYRDEIVKFTEQHIQTLVQLLNTLKESS